MYIETPLLESRPLSAKLGCRVWLKMEALQPSGSFKTRGIGYACQVYKKRGVRRFVSSSGGNAGLAVAYSGRQLGVPVIVVVPESTSNRARNLICAEDAELLVHGSTWQEAHNHALSLLDDKSAYIHPFDDPLIWEGHSTMVDEIVAHGVMPDAIVLSVGGGGLLCGVALGLRRNGLSDVTIVTSETKGADSFHASVKANQLVELSEISSIAKSLGAKKVAVQAFELRTQHKIIPVVVTDAESVGACLQFVEDHRLVTEPACGAALAAIYSNSPALEGKKNVVVIVCGGSTVSYKDLLSYEKAVV